MFCIVSLSCCLRESSCLAKNAPTLACNRCTLILEWLHAAGKQQATYSQRTDTRSAICTSDEGNRRVHGMATSRPNEGDAARTLTHTKHAGGATPQFPLLPDWSAGPSISASKRPTRRDVLSPVPQAQASSVAKLHQWPAFPNKTCQASARTFVVQALKSVYHAA